MKRLTASSLAIIIGTLVIALIMSACAGNYKHIVASQYTSDEKDAEAKKCEPKENISKIYFIRPVKWPFNPSNVAIIINEQYVGSLLEAGSFLMLETHPGKYSVSIAGLFDGDKKPLELETEGNHLYFVEVYSKAALIGQAYGRRLVEHERGEKLLSRCKRAVTNQPVNETETNAISENSAWLHFIRPSFTKGGAGLLLTIDNKVGGELELCSNLEVRVGPGKHSVSSAGIYKGDFSTIDIDMVPRDHYYVKVKQANGSPLPYLKLELIDRKEMDELIEYCKNPEEIKS